MVRFEPVCRLVLVVACIAERAVCRRRPVASHPPTPSVEAVGYSNDNHVSMQLVDSHNRPLPETVRAGDPIRLLIHLTPDDIYNATLPLSCYFTDEHDELSVRLPFIANGCPNKAIINVIDEIKGANRLNLTHYAVDFLAFVFDAADGGRLFISCKILLCVDAAACEKDCWKSDSPKKREQRDSAALRSGRAVESQLGVRVEPRAKSPYLKPAGATWCLPMPIAIFLVVCTPLLFILLVIVICVGGIYWWISCFDRPRDSVVYSAPPPPMHASAPPLPPMNSHYNSYSARSAPPSMRHRLTHRRHAPYEHTPRRRRKYSDDDDGAVYAMEVSPHRLAQRNAVNLSTRRHYPYPYEANGEAHIV